MRTTTLKASFSSFRVRAVSILSAGGRSRGASMAAEREAAAAAEAARAAAAAEAEAARAAAAAEAEAAAAEAAALAAMSDEGRAAHYARLKAEEAREVAAAAAAALADAQHAVEEALEEATATEAAARAAAAEAEERRARDDELNEQSATRAAAYAAQAREAAAADGGDGDDATLSAALLLRTSMRGAASPNDANAALQRPAARRSARWSLSTTLNASPPRRARRRAVHPSCSTRRRRPNGWNGCVASASPWWTWAPTRRRGELAPGVYLGSFAHAQNVELLASLGVTAVLNCAPSMCDDPVAEYEARGWQYLSVDAQDKERYPLLDQHLPAARDFLGAALDGGGVAFVHCYQGINRSAALATAFLVEREAAPLLVVAARCFAARPIILRNVSFCKQLVQFAAASGPAHGAA